MKIKKAKKGSMVKVKDNRSTAVTPAKAKRQAKPGEDAKKLYGKKKSK